MSDERKILSVKELNSLCRRVLEGLSPRGLWIRAEIRNLKFHSSGHLYFALTDKEASIDGVMWRSVAQGMGFKPQEGMAVEAFGTPTLYEKTGRFQFSVRRLLPVGEGARAVAFRQLKRKLAAEGLFDSAHKKPLPEFPSRIGVITSATGAAIRDIIHVLKRRAPHVTVIIRPAKVQGEGAAADIIKGIREMNEYDDVDLLIVGRGGGSEEDLWCFNDEGLARAIFESKLPIISAVGHEIDFTIADLVADLRAPTPSAAAELAVHDSAELLSTIVTLYQTAGSSLKAQLENARSRIDSLASRRVWTEPLRRIHDFEQRLDELSDRAKNAATNKIEMDSSRLFGLAGKLSGLSVKRTLKRGFTIVRKEGAAIESALLLQAGDHIEIEFSDGKRDAVVDGR